MRRINYKSDIPPLLLSLKVDEKQITVPDCDFLVRFYIDGYEGRHYDCSHIGGAWSNCEPSEDGTKLVCYINNQRLGIGELCAEFHYISPDKRYSDGSQKSVVIIDSTELGVELVEDNGDAVTEAAIDVTLPFIYRTAYEIARDHGYTGTAEDFYSALASVVGIADAEKKRVTAEITRNANEQERIGNEENRLNAESERVNSEAQRVRNEAIRGEGENMRIEQEEDRKAKFEEITEFIATVRANEGNRESNERERQANEDTRITEEAKRVEAEKKRATEFEQQKLDLTGKVDRSGDEMGGDLIFTDNAGVSFSTSDGGAHTMFNDTDDVAKFTADNGDTFEFAQENTPNENSSAVVVSANLYKALDMTLDSMGSALDGDAAYRVEAGDKIFNPDTCKIQRYNSTIGGFEDLCDPIEGKLYANKITGYIYRWDTKTKKMVFVGGVKAYTKDEADSRFAKLKDETQTVNVKELNANNFVSAKSMWIGDEGLLLGGDGNGHLTVEEDEVITDVTLNEKLATKADDVAYMVDFNDTNNIEKTGTVKEATQSLVVAAGLLLLGDEQVKEELNSKIDKELHVVLASMGVTLDNVDNAGDSTTMYVANVGDIYYSEGKKHLFYKKSETLTIDLGEPNDKKIYANAMTKRLYIWKGGTWRQCGTDAPQETKESIEEKLGAWLEEDSGESDGEVYTKAESDARYERKNQYLTICGKKQRVISTDRPFDSVLFRAYECGGYLWVGEYSNNGTQITRVARINLNTEEVKILNTPNNTRINRQDKHCITQDEEGNFYWGPVTTSKHIYKCDADLNIIQSFPAGNYDGGWYFGGFLWNYSSNVLKKMDLSGATLKTYEIGTTSNNLIMQKIYGTQHGLFAGKFVWDNETDEIYTLEKSVSLSDTHLGGVTLGGWNVPELVIGYDASTHTFTSEPSINKTTTLGITNYTGRVDEKCVVGNRNCRDIAISFSKGYYVNTINQPLPIPIGTPYYAMDGWMIWSDGDKINILNLLGEWK